MTRHMALRLATYQKDRKAQMVLDKAAEAERVRKQREWDNFYPMVYGTPRRVISNAEYSRILDDARRNHQNVYF